MKLLRINIISAPTCGGLLDGFSKSFRSPSWEYDAFDPLCFIGPNGAGKSQLLQALAEMLQAACYALRPGEERQDGNPQLLFELEYLIRPDANSSPVRVLVARRA